MYAAGHTKGHNGNEQRNAMVSYVNLLPGVDPCLLYTSDAADEL